MRPFKKESDMDEITPLVSKVIQIMSLNGENWSYFNKDIAEISNPIDQLKQLLQILIQEFTTTDFSANYYEIRLLIDNIHDIIDDCPTDFKHFVNWIPKYIFTQKQTINEIQDKIIVIRTHIKQLINLFAEFDTSNSEIELLKQKSFEIVSGMFSPKSLNDSFESCIEQLQKEKKELKSSLIESEQNVKSITAYLGQKIKSLKKKLSIVIDQSQKIIREKDVEINKIKKENEMFNLNILKLKAKIQKLSQSNEQNQSRNRILILQEEKNELKLQNGMLASKNQSLVQENIQLNDSLQQLQNENSELRKESSNSSSLSSIQETLANLSDENRILKENIKEIEIKNKKLLENFNNNQFLLSGSDSSLIAKQANSSSNGSVISIPEIDDFEMEKKSLQIIIKEKDEKINYLEKKLVMSESDKIKQMELIKKTKNEQNNDKSNLDLKKIGFILAEALCQRYNPARGNSEIQRLIEVARMEHIKLSETVRYPIDPFEQANSMINRQENNPTNANIYSQFDNLDHELNTIKLSVK